ncbi:2-oxoglutarate-dependent dioxygenase DAO-like [Mercurialis annua]|uniref:2-oxoglutarate-dependent dioxygenase DAO-like n=1 Tax=Mercurialis annua TaxID=3986 RepID=UPI00215F3C55|nr:2-oxoglutarate-dependent dioxygenase DAO-like [Mercurialis annua]
MMNKNIPSIDASDFPGESEKLRKACEEWGCFRLLNHNIPSALMLEMKDVVRSLLDLPIELKSRNADVITGSGYKPTNQANPLYEALGLYDVASSQAVETFCSQLDASLHQREVISKYGKAIHELALDLARKLGESMGILRNDLFEGWPSQFRINKYHFTSETVGSSGVQIHTDSGFLTILQDDDNVNGLEVMDGSGEFIPVDHQPGTLLVNLGDIATVWSNGRLLNVKHRVQCKQAAIRYTIASFLLGPRDSAVETPPEFVDPQNARLYLPFTFNDYRELRFKTKLQAGEALELLRVNSRHI